MKKNGRLGLFLLILVLIISFMPVRPALSQITTVFVDPAAIVDQTLQSGSTFTVSINVSDVIDLYSYQVIIMWEPAMLDCISVIYGDFFAENEPWVFKSDRINNTEGWAGFVISLMGMIPGVDGSGWLGSLEFLVEDYGSTALAHDYPPRGYLTYLLDSDGWDISFTAVDGYFSNKFLSDIRGPAGVPDGVVDMWDFGFFGLAYGKTSTDPDWNDYKIADIRGPSEPDHPPDGQVDMWDFGYCGLEYGSSI